LRWHEKGRKKEVGKFRHLAKAAQWANINSHFGWFAEDVRNIQFAMTTDGMNPFGHHSSTHSICPVMMSLYNLPP
jgi:hypothetical protein